jgi:hypothetical protein
MGRSTHHVGVFCVGWLFQLGATSPAAVAGAGVAPGSRPRSVAVRAAVVLGRSNRTWAGDTCYHVSGYYELPTPHAACLSHNTVGEVHCCTQRVSKIRLLLYNLEGLNNIILKIASVINKMHAKEGIVTIK